MIFLDTNVISESLRKAPDEAVVSWLIRHDAELALPTVTIAEIAFGIQKIKPDHRAERLERGLADWRRRFADRIFSHPEEAALVYDEIMGGGSSRPTDVGVWRHDRSHRARQRRSLGHSQSQRFRIGRTRPDFAVGFLTYDRWSRGGGFRTASGVGVQESKVPHGGTALRRPTILVPGLVIASG